MREEEEGRRSRERRRGGFSKERGGGQNGMRPGLFSLEDIVRAPGATAWRRRLRRAQKYVSQKATHRNEEQHAGTNYFVELLDGKRGRWRETERQTNVREHKSTDRIVRAKFQVEVQRSLADRSIARRHPPAWACPPVLPSGVIRPAARRPPNAIRTPSQ